MSFMPCLSDRYDEAGTIKDEYFWQDLIVAREIYKANPERHVDIGSRLDGFVAHIASFRECEVFDVRPVNAEVPGVIFRQADLMDPASLSFLGIGGYCDSLSCLHAIEHFGLGRYGDPIAVLGYQQGISNMTRLLKPGGIFYLATPIGQERVEFNANWVFDPRTIVSSAEYAGMKLVRLIIINPLVGPNESNIDAFALENLAKINYQLGIFIFVADNHALKT
jgi:SAM-dependent methyltransferase